MDEGIIVSNVERQEVEMTSQFDINMHTHRLMESEPFFAHLSRRVDKRADEGIPTAGVRINPDTCFYEMVYNPTFMEGLEDEHKTGVLMHEFYHLALMHVADRLPDELSTVMSKDNPTKQEAFLFKMWNIAADLSINPLIGKEKLPESCCYPGVAPFDDEEFVEGKSAEYYFELLKRKADELKDEIEEGEGQMDDHSGWGESGDIPDDAKEIAKERLKQAVKNAVSDADAESRGWGTVSRSVRRKIVDALTTHINWRTVLRAFIKRSNRANKSSTVKRLNRRYPYVHPGRKVKREANIAIAIDQSGSVSDSMLSSFFAELNKLAQLAKFTVVPFDTSVCEKAVFVWEKGQRYEKERVRYGGTDFNAPTEWVNERRFDGLIVLTDMEAYKPVPCKCQRMWMTTPIYAKRPFFNPHPEQMIVVR